jgi:hypothetical protein
MERVTQAAQQIANRPWAAAGIARITAGGRLAARSGLTARSRLAARIALRCASGLAAGEQIAEAMAALRSTAVIATAGGRGTTTAAAIGRTSIVASIRFASAAVRRGAVVLELLHHLGFDRIRGQHPHGGHRNGEYNELS